MIHYGTIKQIGIFNNYFINEIEINNSINYPPFIIVKENNKQGI